MPKAKPVFKKRKGWRGVHPSLLPKPAAPVVEEESEEENEEESER